MFTRLGLIERFNLDRGRLENFAKELSRKYNRVPYHNFTHAFNIAHMCYIIVRTTQLKSYLEEIDILAILVGALGHDLDH